MKNENTRDSCVKIQYIQIEMRRKLFFQVLSFSDVVTFALYIDSVFRIAHTDDDAFAISNERKQFICG